VYTARLRLSISILVSSSRCCCCRIPLLIVKANSVGTATQPHNPAPSLRAMLDLQSTSRHSLEYLLGRLQATRGDSVVLAVSRALESDDQVGTYIQSDGHDGVSGGYVGIKVLELGIYICRCLPLMVAQVLPGVLHGGCGCMQFIQLVEVTPQVEKGTWGKARTQSLYQTLGQHQHACKAKYSSAQGDCSKHSACCL
jgi:hypothetical protein